MLPENKKNKPLLHFPQKVALTHLAQPPFQHLILLGLQAPPFSDMKVQTAKWCGHATVMQSASSTLC